jgi:hypothetical protein
MGLRIKIRVRGRTKMSRHATFDGKGLSLEGSQRMFAFCEGDLCEFGVRARRRWTAERPALFRHERRRDSPRSPLACLDE